MVNIFSWIYSFWRSFIGSCRELKGVSFWKMFGIPEAEYICAVDDADNICPYCGQCEKRAFSWMKISNDRHNYDLIGVHQKLTWCKVTMLPYIIKYNKDK